MTALQNALAANNEVQLTPENYHDATSESNSRVKLFRHRRSQFAGIHVYKTLPKPESTEAMQLGTLSDYLVLTPDLYEKRVAVLPEVNGRTNDGKAQLSEFREQHAGKLFVKREQHDLARSIADAVLKSPLAKPYLADAVRQQIIDWTDEETGLDCRSMRDLWLYSHNLIVDMKTAVDASPRGFASQAWNLQYGHQNAFYVDGHHEKFGTAPDFCFLVVEKAPPHPVAVYDLPAEWVAKAHLQNKKALKAMEECYRTGDWREPWEKDARTLPTPRWAKWEGEWDLGD